LTQNIAYTAAPVSLASHLNHTGQKGKKPINHTLPQESIYKLNDGTCFVFKSEGPLFKKLVAAHFGNDDMDEVFYTQETIQLAVYDMTLAEVIQEYGPVEVV